MPDVEYAWVYDEMVRAGRLAAAGNTQIVAIARNCMPWLLNTLALIDEVVAAAHGTELYVFENDSTDSTDAALWRWAKTRPWATIEHGPSEPRPDSRGFDKERTTALARYRNRCLSYLNPTIRYTVVLDLDPHGGFSVDGLFNSVGWLESRDYSRAGGMGSFSLFGQPDDRGGLNFYGYDAWAARPNFWRDRREEIGFMWFNSFLPPIGSPPIRMNSCFGGLAVYRTKAILTGRYDGNDCEHVGLHRAMYRAGWDMYLNPGCRYIAMLPDGWTPTKNENSAASGPSA